MLVRKELMVGGKPLIIETGKMAKQANGAVVLTYGETVMLVTAVAANSARVGANFLPLTVDYREAPSSAGKIPGGFFKREGRSNEKETLTSRVIDRPLRPLFPAGWAYETQIIAMMLSSDQTNDGDVLGLTGASFALGISNIPFPIPIAAVRVGLSPEGEYLINPTFQQLETSRLNLMLAASDEAVVMVEAGAHELSEKEVLDGIYKGHDAIREIIKLQNELIAEIGKPKREAPTSTEPDGVREMMLREWKEPLADSMRMKNKIESYAKADELKARMLESFPADESDKREFAGEFWHGLQDVILREEVLGKGVRMDGRKMDEIRAIDCEVGLLPRTHGSALFTRGETQALVTVTLGTAADAQRLDWVQGEFKRRFMLHYNFPPFSVGEARFLRGPGRREIGHGALAERALNVVVPGEDDWPYTVRVVSDILESNGSSSMATVCGGSLAMMDAGVPIRSAVAGVAMGLIKVGDKFEVLSDIAGAEDHHGDMDFKVTGTTEGITALQMDIKITGITREIMDKALAQARAGRLHILAKMQEALTKPREDVSQHAPRILTIQIHKDKIRDIIGPGGKMIRSITERTGCKIEIHDDGRVDIASLDQDAAQKAIEIIRELTAEAELAKTYVGRVVRVVNFGAFVEILPGVEGLLHISEIAEERIAEVREVLDEGDETLVKVIDIDAQGRVKLSRRAAMREKEGNAGGDRGRDDRGPRRDDKR